MSNYFICTIYDGLADYQIRKKHECNPIIKTKMSPTDDGYILDIRMSIVTISCLIINERCQIAYMFFDML